MAQDRQSREAARAEFRENESGVLVEICVECGREYTFEDEEPPEELKCEKCGGTVFRAYFEPAQESEAAADFRDSTERDLDPQDAEGDVTEGDLVDLDRL